MRVKQEDSESCQTSVDGNTATCEVIPLQLFFSPILGALLIPVEVEIHE